MLKWVCWECGAENPYHPVKAVQDKCRHCGGELKIGRAPLASTSHIAGFILMVGGLFWGFDELVPAPLSYPAFAVLAILGVVNDPTTAGVADSQRAMSYEAPYKSGEDESVGD